MATKICQSYKPGDIVMSCQPFALTLYNEAKSKYCDYCLREVDDFGLKRLKKCIGCGFMYYCDKKCQVKDWSSNIDIGGNHDSKVNAHNRECKLYRNYNDNG